MHDDLDSFDEGAADAKKPATKKTAAEKKLEKQRRDLEWRREEYERKLREGVGLIVALEAVELTTTHHTRAVRAHHQTLLSNFASRTLLPVLFYRY
jgi:hypothetical protein